MKAQKKSTPVAYQVEEGADGEHVIVFATSGAAARRIGGEMLGIEFSDVSGCRRAHWADEYVGKPYIPAKAYHDAGWWLSCRCCGAHVYADDDAMAPVYEDRFVYCNAQEKRKFHEKFDTQRYCEDTK